MPYRDDGYVRFVRPQGALSVRGLEVRSPSQKCLVWEEFTKRRVPRCKIVYSLWFVLFQKRDGFIEKRSFEIVDSASGLDVSMFLLDHKARVYEDIVFRRPAELCYLSKTQEGARHCPCLEFVLRLLPPDSR